MGGGSSGGGRPPGSVISMNKIPWQNTRLIPDSTQSPSQRKTIRQKIVAMADAYQVFKVVVKTGIDALVNKAKEVMNQVFKPDFVEVQVGALSLVAPLDTVARICQSENAAIYFPDKDGKIAYCTGQQNGSILDVYRFNLSDAGNLASLVKSFPYQSVAIAPLTRGLGIKKPVDQYEQIGILIIGFNKPNALSPFDLVPLRILSENIANAETAD